jgi:hypothetical protein
VSLFIKSVRTHRRRRWYDSAATILALMVLTYGLVLVALATEGPAFYPIQAYKGMVFIVLAFMLSQLHALWNIRRAITRDREVIGDISAHLNVLTAKEESS